MQEQSIFSEALEKEDPAERAAFLDRVCASDPALRQRLDRLLLRHQQGDSFLESPGPALIATLDEPMCERPGTVIGPYKLLEQIGEGGFGIVFMAEQTQPVRRKVALKVLKPGMDTRQVVARFEAERQALAIMDHPNIARVLDAGATPPAHAGGSPRPYFVMDLVKGLPITDYCDQAKLTPRERLELFVSVCLAVQHAHQKGIIHRDIKPSNVLVTVQDGKPLVKVIDFGIAKALGQQLTDKTLFTGFAQLIGTPLYMSPEQAGLSNVDVDTRSDIYSLGVLLYELLTGTTPFDKERLREVDYDEMRRIIREEEPPKPSTRINTLGQAATTVSTQRQSDPRRLSQLCRGELDWIVMKALEKDRNRRYETASAFAADVQRYLNDEPVQACPPSAWYRLRKFTRRNKPTLATLALLGLVLFAAVAVAGVPATVGVVVVVAALAVGVLLLGEANRRARQQRACAEQNLAQAEDAEKRAKEAATRAEAINQFLIHDLLAEADPEKNVYGNQVTIEEFLNRAAGKIDEAFPGQPEVEAAVRLTIGRIYHGLGRWDRAESHLYRAWELSRASRGVEHPGTLEILNDLAVVLELRGKLAEAEPLFRRAFAGCCRALGQEHALTLLALHNLAWSVHDQGNAAVAESLYRRCLEGRRRTLGPEHPDTLTSLHHWAWLLWDQERPALAGPLLREVLKLRRRILPPGHLVIAKTLTLLGWVLTDTGKAPEAELLLREALAVRQKALPAGHWLTAITANILGGCLTALGRYGEAELLLLDSCATLQTAAGFPPGRLPEVLGRLVGLYEAWGKDEEASTWRVKRSNATQPTDRPGRACPQPLGLRAPGETALEPGMTTTASALITSGKPEHGSTCKGHAVGYAERAAAHSSGGDDKPGRSLNSSRSPSGDTGGIECSGLPNDVCPSDWVPASHARRE